MESNFPSLVLYKGKMPGVIDSDLAANLLDIQNVIFNETAFITPLIRLEQDETLTDNTFRLKINDKLQQSVSGLDAGEYWVYITRTDYETVVGELAGDFTARDSVEPNSGASAMIIKPSATLEEALKLQGKNFGTVLQEFGMEVRDRIGYVVFCVAAALRNNVAELVTDGVTDELLRKLESEALALVNALRQEIPLGEVTQSLQRKLDSRETIRDLELILEEMLVEKMRAIAA